MTDLKKLFDAFGENGISFFCGVPDSYLNGFNNYLKDHISAGVHVIAANEGNAIAIAAGHYFATGNVPLVYMQNSGLGNSVNPLLSLTERNVYAVPEILLIGWRGEPGTADGKREQHMAQGRLTKPLLEAMDIPFRVLAEDTVVEDVKWAAVTARSIQAPVALIAPNGVMTEKKKNQGDTSFLMSREEAIAVILDHCPEDAIYAASTGRATRELFCQRALRNEGHEHDYLNLGSMGHASSVALGIALAKPDRRVVCLDGDAAAIMHMGSMAVAGSRGAANYLHVVLNNGAHESVGDQPSVGQQISFTGIAESCGFYTVGAAVTTKAELRAALDRCFCCGKASFLDVHIRSGIRSDLGSITMTSHEMIKVLKDELDWK